MKDLLSLTPSSAKTRIRREYKEDEWNYVIVECECIGDKYIFFMSFEDGKWDVGMPYILTRPSFDDLGIRFNPRNKDGTIMSDTLLKEEFTKFVIGWVKWSHERGHEYFDAKDIKPPSTVCLDKGIVKCLTLRDETFVTIDDLIEHVIFYEKPRHFWSASGEFESNRLPKIDSYSYSDVVRLTKLNLSRYGRNNFISPHEFKNDKHKYWFDERYKVQLKQHLCKLFPELKGS